MQEAVPVGEGAMAAIIGSDPETVAAVCEEASEGAICSPANINSPSQIVIAGDSEAIDRACAILKERGAKRAIRLNVSAPFHCGLMRPAEERLAEDLSRIEYRSFRFPVVHNVTAEPNSDAALVCDLLTRQVTSPVRWLESVRKMIADGVTRFVEVGPGKVLSGLVRQTDREIEIFNVEDSAGIRKSLETI
jgi:[acyl-carrier-protein] S-malonyltransferase